MYPQKITAKILNIWFPKNIFQDPAMHLKQKQTTNWNTFFSQIFPSITPLIYLNLRSCLNQLKHANSLLVTDWFSHKKREHNCIFFRILMHTLIFFRWVHTDCTLPRRMLDENRYLGLRCSHGWRSTKGLIRSPNPKS